MDVISGIVRNVIILVLIFSCLELFLPKGELSRFVRLGFAIILLALIIIPSVNAIKNMRWQLPDLYQADEAAADYEETAGRINMILEKEAMNNYEEGAAQSIAATACLAQGISSAEATVSAGSDGSIIRAEICAVKEADTEAQTAESAIRRILEKYFNISDQAIYIQIREE